MSLLAQCAEAVVQQEYSDHGRNRAVLHFIDSTAALLCGRHTADGERLRSLFRHGAVGGGERHPLDAIALYTAMTRLTEIDDIHLASMTTPGSVVVPTLIGLGPVRRSFDPAEMLDAMIAGYEMMVRLGETIRGPQALGRGIWPSYFCAPFGSAAAASRFLGLTAEQTAQALCLALTMSAGGVSASPRQPFRWLTIGQAARAGSLAAISAAEGFRGNPAMLEHDWLQQTYGIEADGSKLTDRLGEREVMAEVSFKPYCSAKQAIPAIHGWQRLLDQGLQADRVRCIRLRVPGAFVRMIDHGASDRLSSLTSAAYQMALAAYAPDGLYDIDRSHLVNDAAVERFLPKVHVLPDDELSERYPHVWASVVEADTDEGQYRAEVHAVPGDPVPGMHWEKEEVLRKQSAFLSRAIGEAEARKIVELMSAAVECKSAVPRMLEAAVSLIRKQQ